MEFLNTINIFILCHLIFILPLSIEILPILVFPTRIQGMNDEKYFMKNPPKINIFQLYPIYQSLENILDYFIQTILSLKKDQNIFILM